MARIIGEAYVELAPVTTWGQTEESGWIDTPERFAWWLAQGTERAKYIYKIQFYDHPVLGAIAQVFQYAANEEGKRYRDPETLTAAVLPPVIVNLDSLPPEELR